MFPVKVLSVVVQVIYRISSIIYRFLIVSAACGTLKITMGCEQRERVLIKCHTSCMDGGNRYMVTEM